MARHPQVPETSEQRRGKPLEHVSVFRQAGAGLLADLKARGMLDGVLLVWGGEFGHIPFHEKGKGGDHNP